MTFICTTGNPDIGLVKGHFEEGSGGAKYWVKPNTFKIWYPDGWTEGSAVEGKQAMITMAGEQQIWEVWLSLGKGDTHTETGDGSFEISYTQYQHEETFKRDYKIELEKRCDETGKTLADSTFEILEQFDFSQLDGTNLEAEQFRKNAATSEGGFETLSVCQSEITTDGNGHFEHSDQKTYHYSKTYCGGHPEPVIEPAEVSDEASEEEQAEADEKNEQLEQDAWAAWQQCVDWCEQNCDFHSIDEGAARDDMEADRNQAWETFIRLKRIYTVREIQARKGYILHDLHNDDLPVEIVEFMSSQAEGDGEITGHYPGNKKEENGRNGADSAETLETPKVSLSLKERKLVQAAVESSETGSEKERMDLGQRNDAVAMEKRESSGTKSETEEMEPDETKRVETKSGEMESSGTIRDLEKVSQKEEKGEQQENHKKTGEAGENGEVQGESQSGTPNPGNEELEKGELDTTEPEGSEKAEEESIKEREPEITPTEAETEESGQVQPGSTDKGKDSQGISGKGIEESEWEDEEQDMELINDLVPATGSNAREWFDFATPFNAVPSFFAVNRPMGISEDEDEEGTAPAEAGSGTEFRRKAKCHILTSRLTRPIIPELHINKRDMELYEQDGEDSYGKSQADATLEGAVNQDYILQKVSSALLNSGYKGGLTDGPWTLLKLSGQTNGERIEEILEYCASDSFWDACEVDEISQKGGSWYERIRYGYKGIVNQNAIYDKGTGRLVVRREYENGHYYVVYEADQYERDGYRFTVEKRELDREALAAGEIRLKTVYSPVYETYGEGEFILDSQGQKVPVMETVPQYTTQETLTFEEILTPVKVSYDKDRKCSVVHMGTSGKTFEVTETEAKKEVVMEDERITVDFRKTDGLSGEPLEGAVLQLVEKDETVIREWVSGKEPERFMGIHAGTYVIREKKAPEGFVPMKDMVVEIREDQAVQTVIVRNQPIQAEIGKSDGDSGKLLGGATLQLVRNRDGKVIREWVSREGQTEAFKGLESGWYTVRELKAPSGYRKMDPQEIEVKETENVQEFMVKNYKIRHSDGGGGGDRPSRTESIWSCIRWTGIRGSG